MFLFTAYRYAMLHYSPFLFCSCCGVLSMMSLYQHFYFNIFFTVLAFLGILTYSKRNDSNATSPNKKSSTNTNCMILLYAYLQDQYEEYPHPIKTPVKVQKCTHFNKICFRLLLSRYDFKVFLQLHVEILMPTNNV